MNPANAILAGILIGGSTFFDIPLNAVMLVAGIIVFVAGLEK